MAYICYYEVDVQGTDKACRMVYESMPSMDFKDITSEKGKMLNHEITFTGFCADTVDKGTTDDWDKGSFDCDSLTNREIVEEAPGFTKFTHRLKSEKFMAVIKIHSWSAEAGFDRFDFYDNGKVVKQIVVPYNSEDKFDWEKMDYPSNMVADNAEPEKAEEVTAEAAPEPVIEKAEETVSAAAEELKIVEEVVKTDAQVEAVPETVEEAVENIQAEAPLDAEIPVVEEVPVEESPVLAEMPAETEASSEAPVTEEATTTTDTQEEVEAPVIEEIATEVSEEIKEQPETFEPEIKIESLEKSEPVTEPVVETVAEPITETVNEAAEPVAEENPFAKFSPFEPKPVKAEPVTETVTTPVEEVKTEPVLNVVELDQTPEKDEVAEAVQEVTAPEPVEVPETPVSIIPETVVSEPIPETVISEVETAKAPEAVISEPVKQEIPETVIGEPVGEPVAEPITETVAETVTETVAEPVAPAPAPEVSAEPMAEQVQQTHIPGPALEPVTEQPEQAPAPQPKNIVENPDSIYTDYRPIIAMKERQLAALQAKQKEVADQFHEDEEDYLSVKDYIANGSMSAEAFATSIHNDIFKMEAQKRVKEQQLAAEQDILNVNSQQMDNDTAAIRADMKVSDALSEVYKDLIGEYSKIAFKNKNNKAHYEYICMGQRQNDNKSKALQSDYSQIENIYNQKTQGDKDKVYYLQRDIRDLQERIAKKQTELKNAQSNPDEVRPDYSDIENKYNASKANLDEINAQIAQLQYDIAEMSKRV